MSIYKDKWRERNAETCLSLGTIKVVWSWQKKGGPCPHETLDILLPELIIKENSKKKKNP